MRAMRNRWVAGALLCGAAHGTDGTWIGPNNGYWTNAANWLPGSAYPGVGDTATFASNAAQYVAVKIDAILPIGGIVFTNVPFAGTQHSYTLGAAGAGKLVVGSAGISKMPGSWDQTLNSDVSLSADATIYHKNTGQDYNNQRYLTFNGTFDIGTNRLTLAALTRDIYFNGKVTGSGPISFAAGGGTTYFRSSSNDFSGAISADGGGNASSILYVDSSGTIKSSSGISMANRVQFILGSTGSSSNRVGDSAAVSLARYAPRLKLVGQNNAATTEAIGTLTIDGEAPIVEVAKGSGTASATLQPASIARNAVRRPVALVYGTAYALGSGEYVKPADGGASLTLIGGDGSRGTNRKIVPWLFTRTEATGALNGYSLCVGGSSFVTYDALNGLVPLNASNDFVNAVDTNFPAVNADGDDNVRMPFTVCKPGAGTNAAGVLAADTTVNSLLFYNDTPKTDDGDYTLVGPGRTLTIRSGLIMGGLSSLADRFQDVFLNVSTIDFASAEGIILFMGPHYGAFRIASALRGTNGLTLYIDFDSGNGGEGCLYLSGNNSGLAGPLTVINNTLIPQHLNALGSGSNTLALARGYVKPGVGIGGGRALTVGALTGYGTVMDGGNPFNIGATNGVASRYRLLGSGLIGPGDAAQAGTLTLKTPSGYRHDWSNGVVAVDLFATNRYDVVRLDSSGAAALTITNTALQVTLGFLPPIGSCYPVVQVTGSSIITGKFAQADSLIAQKDASRVTFDVLYNSAVGGGDGNDVVLRVAQVEARYRGTVVLLR